jgi:hypothetical protein
MSPAARLAPRESQLHVPNARRQALRVVIAAKKDHRHDLIRAASDPEIELSLTTDFPRGFDNLRARERPPPF